MAIILQCVPAGHIFNARLSFGESTSMTHCPDCGKVVPTHKP